MAGDWIKMRVWLRRDPKVIRMADTLARLRPFMDWVTNPVRVACNGTVYEHVTSDVTRALCVTGLLEVWGTAREQGDRDGDDLVIDHCDLGTLDDITGIPCFGEAMGAVRWAIETKEGSLVFPKFFADKASPEQRHRTGNAERQARYRERKRNTAPSQCNSSNSGDVTGNVTDDVTVTGQRREEKRRDKEEPNTLPDSPKPAESASHPSPGPDPVDATPTPPSPKSPRAKPTGPHAEAIDGFCARWHARYGTKYPFSGGKDGALVKKILATLGGSVTEFLAVVDRYLADNDPFYISDNHSLARLSSHLTRWIITSKPESPRAQPTRTARQTQADDAWEIIARHTQAAEQNEPQDPNIIDAEVLDWREV